MLGARSDTRMLTKLALQCSSTKKERPFSFVWGFRDVSMVWSLTPNPLKGTYPEGAQLNDFHSFIRGRAEHSFAQLSLQCATPEQNPSPFVP